MPICLILTRRGSYPKRLAIPGSAFIAFIGLLVVKFILNFYAYQIGQEKIDLSLDDLQVIAFIIPLVGPLLFMGGYKIFARRRDTSSALFPKFGALGAIVVTVCSYLVVLLPYAGGLAPFLRGVREQMLSDGKLKEFKVWAVTKGNASNTVIVVERQEEFPQIVRQLRSREIPRHLAYYPDHVNIVYLGKYSGWQLRIGQPGFERADPKLTEGYQQISSGVFVSSWAH